MTEESGQDLQKIINQGKGAVSFQDYLDEPGQRSSPNINSLQSQI